jgi:hypothetical protein
MEISGAKGDLISRQDYPSVQNVELVQDEVDKRPDNLGFFISNKTLMVQHVPAHGEAEQPMVIPPRLLEYILVPCIPRDVDGNIVCTHLSITVPTVNMAHVLARSNPSRPETDAPVGLFETKDLPGMIRDIAKLKGRVKNLFKKPPSTKLLDDFANDYLGYSFGWAPLYNDMKNVIQLNDLIHKRTSELVRLHSNGGLRRRITTFSQKVSSGGVLAPISDPTNSNWPGTRKKQTAVTQWVVTRWNPTDSKQYYPSLTNPYLRSQAREAVLGMTIDPSTAWELMPWSWMADYFSNVGDIFSAGRNIVHAKVGQYAHIMTRRETTEEWESEQKPLQWRGTRPRYTLRKIDKQRQLMSTVLTPRIDLSWLTGGQLSILAAIGWKNR